MCCPFTHRATHNRTCCIIICPPDTNSRDNSKCKIMILNQPTHDYHHQWNGVVIPVRILLEAVSGIPSRVWARHMLDRSDTHTIFFAGSCVTSGLYRGYNKWFQAKRSSCTDKLPSPPFDTNKYRSRFLYNNNLSQNIHTILWQRDRAAKVLRRKTLSRTKTCAAVQPRSYWNMEGRQQEEVRQSRVE